MAFTPPATAALPLAEKVTASSHRSFFVSAFTRTSLPALIGPLARAATSWANTRVTTVAPTPTLPDTDRDPAQLYRPASSTAFTITSPRGEFPPAASDALPASAVTTFLATTVLTAPPTDTLLETAPETEATIILSLPAAPI